MPWRGPEVPGEYPTLGYLVADWIEAHCVIPDGEHAGAPYLLTDEMLRFLLGFYRLDPRSGRFTHGRGGQLVRPQKWGKGPFSAALAIAEAHHEAPVLPDGWDARGEPVGRPWPTPWVQITAVSEDQTDNVFRALVPMIELGPLAASVPDTGETRVNLPGGGRIEPVTASARSRLGQRVTFTVQDEALALDTPILTTAGWSTVGEIVPGDHVFGSHGLPTIVKRRTAVQVGRECFRVTFSDGTSVVTSDGHMWMTRVAVSRALPRVRTTGEMFRDGRRFQVPLGGPVWVTITSIDPVESVPVACIEVEAQDHLFRVGESNVVTHNTHSWTTENGGRRLADNQRRNLSGMGGRWLETTNAWDPAEGSVAQHTAESGEPGVYRDQSDPGPGSVFNKQERRRMVRRAYGDSLRRRTRGWVDPDRIDQEIQALLPRDPAQAERFFLNRVRSEADSAFDLDKWRSLACPGWVAPTGDLIVIGVDGARFQDSLAAVACHVETGHLWPLGVWTRPEWADEDYEHPLDEVDAVMRDAFQEWHVWRVYIDPQKIGSLVDGWRGRWGDDRVLGWVTSRPRQMAYAVRGFRDAIAASDLTHDGDDLVTQHVANARRWRTNVKDEEGRPMMLIGKDRPGSPRKMDAAVACVLAWEARGDAIAADAKPTRRSSQLVFV